jgi:hypothetical protein
VTMMVRQRRLRRNEFMPIAGGMEAEGAVSGLEIRGKKFLRKWARASKVPANIIESCFERPFDRPASCVLRAAYN